MPSTLPPKGPDGVWWESPSLEQRFGEKGWFCLDGPLEGFLEAAISSLSVDVTYCLFSPTETMGWGTPPSSLKWFLVKTRRVNMSWHVASTQCAAGVRHTPLSQYTHTQAFSDPEDHCSGISRASVVC